MVGALTQNKFFVKTSASPRLEYQNDKGQPFSTKMDALYTGLSEACHTTINHILFDIGHTTIKHIYRLTYRRGAETCALFILFCGHHEKGPQKVSFLHGFSLDFDDSNVIVSVASGLLSPPGLVSKTSILVESSVAVMADTVCRCKRANFCFAEIPCYLCTYTYMIKFGQWSL